MHCFSRIPGSLLKDPLHLVSFVSLLSQVPKIEDLTTAFLTQVATSIDASSSSSRSSPIDNFLLFSPQNPAPPPLPIKHPSHWPHRTELKILQDNAGPLVEGKYVRYLVKRYTEHLESVSSPTSARELSMEEPEIVPNMDGSENDVGDLALAFAAVVYAQTIEEPRSLSKALNSPQANNWKNGIGDKIRSLLQTSTF